MVVWLREALEASLRAVDLFIEYYRATTQDTTLNAHTNRLADFVHCREMFRATQLRLVSLHQRLDSINSIASQPRNEEMRPLTDTSHRYIALQVSARTV
jgi:hypothetical protein